ncbi:MAG: peptidoglycan synthetase, partial [Marivirga sp.]|nr:peptidoglycan synthetase [Marivirga sp.]
AQVQVVYFNPEKMKAKDLEPLNESDIRKSFNNPGTIVFDDASRLEEFLLQQSMKNKDLLMMSSGNFGGLNLIKLSEKLLNV